jgi:hypothetical protein
MRPQAAVLALKWKCAVPIGAGRRVMQLWPEAGEKGLPWQ